jgi:3D (Asp-Asp-Asp) domain-containing protein
MVMSMGDSCANFAYHNPVGESVSKVVVKTEVKGCSKIVARITYYAPGEVGDPWTPRISSSNKKRAIEGTTVAIDPLKIPYGSQIWIPSLKDKLGNGMFVAEDTGKAVKKLKAIPKHKRKEIQYVIDIYVGSKEKVNTMSSKNDKYMDVYIFNL